MRLTACDAGNIHYLHKKPQQFKDIFGPSLNWRLKHFWTECLCMPSAL